MSLHIHLTPEAEAERRRAALRDRLASLSTCLACVGLAAVALYFSVVLLKSEPNAHFIGILSSEDAPAAIEMPKVKRLSLRHSAPASPSLAPNLLVSTEPADTPLPLPDTPVANAAFATGTSLDNVGMEGSPRFAGPGSGGIALGDIDLNDDAPSSDPPSGGSTLEGVFYDLKQTRSGAKTSMAAWDAKGEPAADMNKVTTLLREFIAGDWSPSVLAPFYRSRTKLRAGCFYLPSCDAAYAPVAYRCADRVRPKAWVALYKGKVKAPKSGKFRFVGTGDDVLAVRFNKKTVLEAGWCIPSQGNGTIGSLTNEAGRKYHKEITTRAQHPVSFFRYAETPKWNRELGGLKAGDIFEVKEGRVYPIEILISEIPGGAFGFVLLIQDLNEPVVKKASNGIPMLQLFRTNFAAPTPAVLRAALKTPEKDYVHGPMECPPYDEDSLLWIAVP